jgi:NAD(P)-dependent dehydrogenase (short-subunit alcohol dehydrogenase family)
MAEGARTPSVEEPEDELLPPLGVALGALEGRLAVVTGAASGIGRATAELVVGAGGRLLGVDRDREGLARLRDELGAAVVVADVAEEGSWPALRAAAERAGGLGLVHLNAGVACGVEDLGALPVDQYRRVLGVNLDQVVFGLGALGPLLAAQGGGALVATASLAGLVPLPGDPIYTATKHAVVGLVRAVAPSMAERGVRVHAVCPGMVDTPLLGPEVRRMLAEAHFPLIDARAVAEAVVRVAAADAVGQAVVVQAGRPPIPFRFRRPPGPRTPGAEGAVPPGRLGDPG